MLWHHMIVDGKLDRPIYETFGDKAYPLMTEIVKVFPEYAWHLANATLIGKSGPSVARKKDEPIISVYIPGPPRWHNQLCDHHAIKFHMNSGKVTWKILEATDAIYNEIGRMVWQGTDYDMFLQPTNETHVYYDQIEDAYDERDLVGIRYIDNKEVNKKVYLHPHWVDRGDGFIETTWNHLPIEIASLLPIDVSPVEDMEKTRGEIKLT